MSIVWEYKIVRDWEDGNPDSEGDLNELGAEGWELIHVEHNSLFSSGDNPQQLGTGKVWYFKRHKRHKRVLRADLCSGLTQRRFAEKVGLSQPEISRLIAGKIESVYPLTLFRLSQGMGVSLG